MKIGNPCVKGVATNTPQLLMQILDQVGSNLTVESTEPPTKHNSEAFISFFM